MELVGSGTDRELDEHGTTRARKIGQGILQLIDSGILHGLSGAIITSPLKRAIVTAEAISDATGFDIIVRDELRAQHFGALEGKTKAEILEDPNLAVHLHSNLPPHKLLTDQAPGGESVQSAFDRMRSIRSELFASHDGNPIVITHGSMLKTLVGSTANRPIDEWGGITAEFKNRLIEDDYQHLKSVDYE